MVVTISFLRTLADTVSKSLSRRYRDRFSRRAARYQRLLPSACPNAPRRKEERLF
jgi:hypothetical protein